MTSKSNPRVLKKKCDDCKQVIYPDIQGYVRWPTGALLHIDCWERQKRECNITIGDELKI